MSETLSARREDALLLILNDMLYRLGFVWDAERGEYVDTASTGTLGPLNRNPATTIAELLQPPADDD